MPPEAKEPEKKAIDEFRAFLENHRDEKHVIVIQDYPDPDAISSALAHQLIAGEYGISSDIVYCGEVSHPENLALVRVLEVEMISWTPEFEAASYDGAIFIDNQAVNTTLWPKLQEAGVKPLAVVDHHSMQGGLK